MYFGIDFQTKRIFGHPNLINVPNNIHGKDVYSLIARLLPEHLRGWQETKESSSLPFTLHLVDQQVSSQNEQSITVKLRPGSH